MVVCILTLTAQDERKAEVSGLGEIFEFLSKLRGSAKELLLN